MKLPRTLFCVFAAVAALSGITMLPARENTPPLSPAMLREIARVEAEIDQIESESLRRLAAPPDNQVQRMELLGKLLLFDKELSVNRNEACAFCHMPETGFTGPISEITRTTGAYPGSVRTRFSERTPQTHTYAPLAPVLHYNEGQGDLVGGNFWDMRATGRRLGNPAAEQAEGPPVDPTEMALPDIACAVYRASQRPYRSLFEAVWGLQAFAVSWPANTEDVCNQPGPPSADDPAPVHLSAVDRGRAAATFDQMAQSIAGYEASHEVTAFSSKYDAVLAGKTRFTRQEQEGYDIFRGKAKCNDCHRDGGPGEDRFSPTSRRAISERPPIRSCPTIPKTNWISAAILLTRAVRLSSISALAAFLRTAIHSASLPLLMRAGNLWRRKIAVVSRCPRCAMSTSGRVPIL
jgi:cytochrome c peroxidase